MYKKLIFFGIFCFVAKTVLAQNIKTVQLRPLDQKRFSAIVPLGTVLELSFDDLEADNKEYQYKIEHMTFDWKPSSLTSSQYIDGFEQNSFNDISNSFNTFQNYTHYSLRIPNQSTRITKSGNYLISVLDEDDEILFSRKFVLYENITTVGVSVQRSRNIKTSNQQQTVQFLVNHENLRINNPNQEINVVVLQNNNWNTTITDLKPNFYKPNQLIYRHTNTSNFNGGNEYLNLDSKNIRNTSLHIGQIEQKEIFHNYVYVDEPRADKIYTYNPDINGQFVVRTLESDAAATEADYAMMHFALDPIEPYKNKEVYVYGAFNNFELLEENKMSYNKNEGMYETSFPLKQGFYNYNYATVDSDGKVDLTEIDGSFFQTENLYTVIVYHKPFGQRYHRVIGVGNGFFDQNR